MTQPKSFIKAQDLSRVVYKTAREQVLRTLAKTVELLDALYAQDAETIKRELAKLFEISGIPQRRAAAVIDKVLAASREKRVELVRGAIVKAARAGRKLDEATFETVFGKDADPKKTAGRSGLRLIETPSKSPASESEDEPPSAS